MLYKFTLISLLFFSINVSAQEALIRTTNTGFYSIDRVDVTESKVSKANTYQWSRW